MRYRFFTIPIHDEGAAADEFNRCLAEARVLAVDRQFVADGANSAWVVCVVVHDGGERRATAARRGGKVDYKEVLNADDFAVFARLRELRKQLAERDGVPPYAVFTNEQLAAIVQGRVTSAAALKAIDGVGDAAGRPASRASAVPAARRNAVTAGVLVGEEEPRANARRRSAVRAS